jgi:hypothetical protein
VFFEHARDLGVQRLAPSLQQRIVGCILHQDVQMIRFDGKQWVRFGEILGD